MAEGAADVLGEVEAVLVARRDDPPAGGTYSAGLVADPVLAQRKIMEEAFEFCLELGRGGPDVAVNADRTAEEAADLLFHVLAGLVGARVGLSEVLARLAQRRR